MTFFERVKTLVKQKNITLRGFIENLSINYDTYNSARKANNFPRADDAVKIAHALNTTVEYLVTGETSNLSEIKLAELKEKLKKLHEST